MEMALEMEDDLFFADLSKQISLLIMEEDDDVVVEEDPIAPYWQYYSSSLQGFTRAVGNPAAPTPISAYDQVNCGREISKGTGVFIPKSSQPRRKSRQGRSNSSSSSRSQRQSTDQFNSLNRSSGQPQQFSHRNTSYSKKF